MARSLSPWLLALFVLPACGDDGGGGETGASTVTSASTTGMGSSTGDDSSGSTSGDSTSSSSTTDPSTSTTDAPTTTDDGTTTGPVNMCDPVVPGEFNSCVDGDGNIDNTLCNWMGTSGANGFIGCLSSSTNPDANVCMISDCVEDCDCFAPPATGNAPVQCAEVLAGGGMACVLTCDMGETCPDTMECIDGLCFHPPA